jgi:hypothetical protein
VHIPLPAVHRNCESRPSCTSNCSFVVFDSEVPYCPDETNSDMSRRHCGTHSRNQEDYRGDVRTSVSGQECINWADSVEAVGEFAFDFRTYNACSSSVDCSLNSQPSLAKNSPRAHATEASMVRTSRKLLQVS